MPGLNVISRLLLDDTYCSYVKKVEVRAKGKGNKEGEMPTANKKKAKRGTKAKTVYNVKIKYLQKNIVQMFGLPPKGPLHAYKMV